MELMRNEYTARANLKNEHNHYIGWIISNSEFYTLNADPNIKPIDSAEYFGIDKMDRKLKTFWRFHPITNNCKLLSLKDFIERLEVTSGIPQYLLINKRKEIGLDKFNDLYPVGDYYERENTTTTSDSLDQNSNDLDQSSNVTDPNEGNVQQYSNNGIEESDPEIKTEIIDFDIPKGYRVDSYQLFNCQNSDPTYKGNNKVFIKFKLKKL